MLLVEIFCLVAVRFGNRFITHLGYALSCRCRDGSAAEVELKTKYFTAKLQLLPTEVNANDGIYGSEYLTRALQSVEGIIDVVPFNEVRPHLKQHHNERSAHRKSLKLTSYL